MLRKTLGQGAVPMADAVRWLAELGGYTGISSGGPPGARVIARELARIESIVEVLSSSDKM